MDAATMSERISIQDARVSFGSTHVLRGVNLEIERGEIVAVLGKSGCGKTTLLRGCCALIPLDSGKISLDGQIIIKGPKCLFKQWEIRRKMMYVAQTPTLLPYMTALDNVTLPLRIIREISSENAMEIAKKVAAELHLDSLRLQCYPEQLSGGEAQRVQLLRAIVLQPDVLLLDEVTANIDPEITNDVVETLWLLRERSGRSQTIVIVTHIVDFAECFADRIVFMHAGVIHEQGSAQSFIHSAQCEETRQFLSSLHKPNVRD